MDTVLWRKKNVIGGQLWNMLYCLNMSLEYNNIHKNQWNLEVSFTFDVFLFIPSDISVFLEDNFPGLVSAKGLDAAYLGYFTISFAHRSRPLLEHSSNYIFDSAIIFVDWFRLCPFHLF